MFEKIRENPTFLRYYEIWRTNPSSVVFAPLAEMLILHKCYEEAITVCKKGLDQNPDLISGRVALAKAYVGVANHTRALEEAKIILGTFPEHPLALEIYEISGGNLDQIKPVKEEALDTEALDFVSEVDRQIDEKIEKKAANNVESPEIKESKLDPEKDNRWNTVTMAEIFASQGNMKMAKKIFTSILENEPTNARASEGLQKLRG